MLAAENGALPGGKVGGIGDVIRELPLALAGLGWAPIVLTPSYGMFAHHHDAVLIANVEVPFAGRQEIVEVFQVPGPEEAVTHIVLEHAFFSPQGPGRIYCDDGSAAPFATDATKFAFFCMAAAMCLKQEVIEADLIHLHDWHTALFLALRQFHGGCVFLQSIRTVYTIHNLALQGIRPLQGHCSAFETWYPGMHYHHNVLVDPRYHDCVNPMALAVRLADMVNTVSPTYALEILDANDSRHGFYGGEGLELDLQAAAANGRLVGILNGCAYDDRPKKAFRRAPAWKTLRDTMLDALQHWMSRTTYLHSSHYLSAQKITRQLRKKPTSILLSIGRVTPQKVGLFLETCGAGDTALEAILKSLDPGVLFVLLGNGEVELEKELTTIANRHANCVFLEGYIDSLPDLLYRSADLFLMPSTFEPCGISQMMAMREGTPCVVHGVGGLKDTVEHLHTGFVFSGDSPREQADNFVATVSDALALKNNAPEDWKTLCDTAAAVRFSWDQSAVTYEQELYERTNT